VPDLDGGVDFAAKRCVKLARLNAALHTLPV
jgi:hypothetical protein